MTSLEFKDELAQEKRARQDAQARLADALREIAYLRSELDRATNGRFSAN